MESSSVFSNVEMEQNRQFFSFYSKSEKGIIADAWWQPFYYTDAPLDGFDPISLVVIGSGELEATLTVTLDRSLAVREIFSHLGFETRIHQVWVNPAFYRFLEGDFK